jgi:hypothetical protein
LAEAVAKGLEVPSEPEPKTAPEAKDKSLTEWQRLFADSVVNVAATDLSALSEPEAEKKPDWETEQKRTDEEMKVKLKKKVCDILSSETTFARMNQSTVFAMKVLH